MGFNRVFCNTPAKSNVQNVPPAVGKDPLGVTGDCRSFWGNHQMSFRIFSSVFLMSLQD